MNFCCGAAFGEHEASCFNYKGSKMSEEVNQENEVCEQGKSGNQCCKNNNMLADCEIKTVEDKAEESSDKE